MNTSTTLQIVEISNSNQPTVLAWMSWSRRTINESAVAAVMRRDRRDAVMGSGVGVGCRCGAEVPSVILRLLVVEGTI